MTYNIDTNYCNNNADHTINNVTPADYYYY